MINITERRQNGTFVSALWVCFTIVLIGCVSVDEKWEITKKRDSAGYYSLFIKEYPDSKYVAEAEARIQEIALELQKQKEIRTKRNWERKVRLEERSKERIAAGDLPPDISKIGSHLLSYSLAQCNPPLGAVVFMPSSVGLLDQDGFEGEAVICENHEVGRRIAAYRKWYCEGEKRICITGEWAPGLPLYTGGLNRSFRITDKTGKKEISIRFSPSQM